jgi:putative hydrolase
MSTEIPEQDMHVHSTFSDGNNTIEENIEEAEALGLRQLTCVDHVRADTDYLPEYAKTIRRLRETTRVELVCGIEAKLIDTTGRLDLPPDLPDGIDLIYAADHQVPLADGPHHPREVKTAIEDGAMTSEEVIGAIIESTANACERHEDELVIAHMFSVLPKIGLEEGAASEEALASLAETAARTGNRIEISERWRCPNARTLRPFVQAGVEVLVSTDSHRRDHIGRYEFTRNVWRELY